MSVLACNRTGCSNVMCDRCSSAFGYICYECFDELVELGIDTDVKEFMSTPHQPKPSLKPICFGYFHILFPMRD